MTRALPFPFARRAGCRGCARLRKALADRRALASALQELHDAEADDDGSDDNDRFRLACNMAAVVLRVHGPRRRKT